MIFLSIFLKMILHYFFVTYIKPILLQYLYGEGDRLQLCNIICHAKKRTTNLTQRGNAIYSHRLVNLVLWAILGITPLNVNKEVNPVANHQFV